MDEPVGRQVAEMNCGHCGAKFTPKREWQRFCSSACRFADWNEKNPRQRIVGEQLQRIEAKLDALRGEAIVTNCE